MKNVKAFAQVGLMKKPSWLRGELVSRDENNATVIVYGNTLVLENHKVKEWERLKFVDGVCEKLTEFQDQNWDQLKDHCKNMVAKFLPEIVLNFDDQEKIVTVDDDIQIMGGVIEQESIARFFEIPVWTVTQFCTRYYGRMQPPDVDEIDLGNSRSSLGAARILVESIIRNRLDQYCEAITDDELVRSFNDY